MQLPDDFPYRSAFLHGRPVHQPYDSFWCRHPPMAPEHRAKIFLAYDALEGHREELARMETVLEEKRVLSQDQEEELDRTLTFLKACGLPLEVTVTRFVPHGKGRGQYRTLSGTFLDVTRETLTLSSGSIPLEDLYELRCDAFQWEDP